MLRYHPKGAGMRGDWSIDQVVFLIRNYPDMPWDRLKAEIDAYGVVRSIDAINSKARELGVFRRIKGNERVPVREMVIRELTTHREQTVNQLYDKIGNRRSAIWKTLSSLKAQGNAHISRYTTEDGVVAAVWSPGRGIDADPPKDSSAAKKQATLRMKKEAKKPVPIPRPKLGAWGCVW